ncbi:hypothetical protein AMTRI_Chr08g163300 [Amborella trichopoda]
MDFQTNLVLPNELIGQILSSLPVKSICKFKCLSISWKHFLSSPYFARIHYISPLLPSSPFALFYIKKNLFCLSLFDIVKDTEIPLKPIKLLRGDLHQHNNIASHSHGLMCYMIWDFMDFLALSICNPAMQEHIALPKLPLWSGRSKSHILGFYFNPVSLSFTILVTLFIYTSFSAEHWLFSSSRGHWKKIIGGFEMFSHPHKATYLCIRGKMLPTLQWQ